MKFTLSIVSKVSSDIQTGVDYYNSKRPKQGAKFKKAVFSHLETLKTNPFFEIRYDNVRCLPIKKYPYLIEFTVNEETKVIRVFAVLHTSMDNPNLSK